MKMEASGKILMGFLLLSEVNMKRFLVFGLIIGVLLSALFCGCLNQSQPVTLKEKEANKKITLMVYMAADNDLEGYALNNLKQLENGKNENINVLVLLDRADGYDETEGNWTDTRLFEVIHDKGSGAALKSKRLDCPPLGLSATQNTELDMANSLVLKNFIEYSKEAYKAENYVLIIWGHGNGWRAVTIDERSSSYMSVHDLGQAVQGQGLCVIGFDTCFGGVIENLYELKNCAEYTVATPGITPSGGWNYKNLLESFNEENITPDYISRKMAENSAGQTCIFLNEKLNSLMDSFEYFSMTLAQEITDSSSQTSVFQELLECKSFSYSQYPCDLYLEINSFADLYFQKGNAQVSGAAEKLKKELQDCVFYADGSRGSIGVHFTEKPSAGTVVGIHSADYKRNPSNANQNLFIKESQWWVPTATGASGSLLDKLFYTNFD